MTGVDMHGDILSPLLSAPVWNDTLCFFFVSICPQERTATEPSATLPLFKKKKNKKAIIRILI